MAYSPDLQVMVEKKLIELGHDLADAQLTKWT